jgi:succinate dehydrogenase hydrophobic anchor subunit
MLRLLPLLIEHDEIIIEALERRKASSMYNKVKHQKLIDSLTWHNHNGIRECITDVAYNHPLECMIAVAELPPVVKHDMLVIIHQSEEHMSWLMR